MRQEISSWVTVGGLVSLSVVVVLVGSRITDLDASISAMVRSSLLKNTHMQTLEQDVERPAGSITHVITTRQDGETTEAFVERHDATVAYLRAN